MVGTTVESVEMPDDLVAVFQYHQRPENPELHVCSSP
jgi:hypothetical protein